MFLMNKEKELHLQKRVHRQGNYKETDWIEVKGAVRSFGEDVFIRGEGSSLTDFFFYV